MRYQKTVHDVLHFKVNIYTEIWIAPQQTNHEKEVINIILISESGLD